MAHFNNLIAADVEVDAGGVGPVKVHATRRVRVDASGVGSFTVWGNPPARNVCPAGLAR